MGAGRGKQGSPSSPAGYPASIDRSIDRPTDRPNQSCPDPSRSTPESPCTVWAPGLIQRPPPHTLGRESGWMTGSALILIPPRRASRPSSGLGGSPRARLLPQQADGRVGSVILLAAPAGALAAAPAAAAAAAAAPAAAAAAAAAAAWWLGGLPPRASVEVTRRRPPAAVHMMGWVAGCLESITRRRPRKGERGTRVSTRLIPIRHAAAGTWVWCDCVPCVARSLASKSSRRLLRGSEIVILKVGCWGAATEAEAEEAEEAEARRRTHDVQARRCPWICAVPRLRLTIDFDWGDKEH